MESSAKITKSLRKEDADKKWWVVDATNQTLGRLSSQVAALIRGKHKAHFTPHVDCGDFVIVINADKIQIKGKRFEQKEYMEHSGYPGGVKIRTFRNMIVSNPAWIIETAVRGMLPKSKLGRKMCKNIKAYAGGEHPHQAQQPKIYELKYN
ncbi:MAG: 50S ribosomal protein L13 [Bacteroidota bacterium]